jgi:acetyltransferase
VADDVVIREAGAHEADALATPLADLHLEAVGSGMALGQVEPVDVGALRAEWRREIAALGVSRRALVIAERADDVVAMALLVPSTAANARHRAEVQRVAVATAARGAGIGRRLMDAVEKRAATRGITLLYLTTHAGTDACAFYEACGYIQLGVMPDYSARPDGTLAPGAFYYRVLTARRP